MEYKINDIIEVTITSIVPYGIFVKADYDYTGLIHISEVTGGYINDLSKFFKINNKIQAKIIGIDKENKQLKLSTKDVLTDYSSDLKSLKDNGDGFELLKDKLPEWIDMTKKELENNK